MSQWMLGEEAVDGREESVEQELLTGIVDTL